MATTLDVLRVLSLGSAIVWWAVGIAPVARTRTASPFQIALTTCALLIGVWAFLDAIYLGLPAPQATLVSDARIAVIAFATFVLLLATKWISRGHSRYDVLLVVPMAASLGLVWVGSASNPGIGPWGYGLWAAQQLVYVVASIALSVALYAGRKGLSTSVRRRFFWTVESLVLVLAIALSANIYDDVTQTAGEPWLSSLLAVPAAIILLTTLPLSVEDWGEMLRAVSAIQERVIAVYMFYRTGEPLVALASNRSLPIEAEQLEGILSVVGNFVESSVPLSRGYAVTAMRYDGLGVIAVRGEFVIVAAVYDGRAYDALRSELTRALKVFEERSWRALGSWEEATKVAEAAADELSNLLHRPERTTPPSLPKVSSTDVELRKVM